MEKINQSVIGKADTDNRLLRNTPSNNDVSIFNEILKNNEMISSSDSIYKTKLSLPNPQERMEKLAKEISKRGSFTSKGEADWLYQNNNNPNLIVNIDASKLTVDINHGKGWYNDKQNGGKSTWGDTGHGKTFNSDFQIHGTVTVNDKNGKYRILTEKYDFEMKPWSTHTLRNIKTFIAEPSPSGVGTPYWISYRGTPNIEIKK